MTAAADREGLREARPNGVTNDMLAAAWEVVRARYPQGRVLGPGPGFREAIAAALALRPADDAAAQAVAERDEARTNYESSLVRCNDLMDRVVRLNAEAAESEDRVARLSAEVEALRAALKPFVEAFAGDDDHWPDDALRREGITFGHLRAARTFFAGQDKTEGGAP